MKFTLYSAVIENLPMEMRERFTDMRELDLKVESKFIYIRKYVKAVYGSIKCLLLACKKSNW